MYVIDAYLYEDREMPILMKRENINTTKTQTKTKYKKS